MMNLLLCYWNVFKAEKEQLIKEKKIKRDKNESVIYKGDDNKYYKIENGKTAELEVNYTFPNSWVVIKLGSICQLTDGTKKIGRYKCLDAKFLRGKSIGDYLDSGHFVVKGNDIILVDGENSGEVFTVPTDGYMGSTFKQLWISCNLYKPFVLLFILLNKDNLRNSKKGAAIPHLNKEIFYNLILGLPPYEEQKRIVEKVNKLFELIK
jgi:type I restriction enzyme S subunit